MTDPYWNHNVHYHPLVLDAVPDGSTLTNPSLAQVKQKIGA